MTAITLKMTLQMTQQAEDVAQQISQQEGQSVGSVQEIKGGKQSLDERETQVVKTE